MPCERLQCRVIFVLESTKSLEPTVLLRIFRVRGSKTIHDLDTQLIEAASDMLDNMKEIMYDLRIWKDRFNQLTIAGILGT